MNCQEIKTLLSAYVDHELDAKDMQKIQAHIENCSECKKELQELQELKNLLSTIDDDPVPEVFNQRLHLALAEEAKKIRQERLLQVIPLNKKKFANWRRISSIAAVFMVGLFSVILYNGNLDEFNQQDLKNANEKLPSTMSALDHAQEDEMENIVPREDEGETETAKKEASNDSMSNDLPSPNKSRLASDGSGNASNEGAENVQNHAMPALIEESVQNATDSTIQSSESPNNLEPMMLYSGGGDTPDEMAVYLAQLEQILIDISYEVDSYTMDSATGIWTINVTMTTINADNSESKESAVYCGQDGTIWKKEL